MGNTEWLKSEGAVGEVRRLLEKSGAPLELRASARADEFQRRERTDDLNISSERIVYGDGYDVPLRELDLCTTLYEEFEAGPHVGVQLIFHVLVECKYRADVQVFGFRLSKTSPRSAAFPIQSSFSGSEFVRALRRPGRALQVDTLSIGLVEIENGQHPKKIVNEDLVFGAGTALYSYITSMFRRKESADAPQPILRAVTERFDTYLSEKHFAWWSVMHKWKREHISASESEEYSRWLAGDKALYGSIDVFLSVLCVDAPMFSVSSDQRGLPWGFEPTNHLVTSLRVPNWPHIGRGQTVQLTPEVPLVVANLDGLTEVYGSALEWFREIKERLTSTESETVERAWLEAAFCRSIREAHDDEVAGFNSDLDIEQWL